MIKESKMSSSITPSLTRKLFNMACEIGEDVINLTLGDPDVMPPEEVKRAACDAIVDGKTRYSANAGLLELREKYSDFFYKQYGISVSPQNNIIVTVGGMEALFLALSSVVDAEDEVVVISPYYINYFQMIHMCGGKSVSVNRLGKSDEELLKDIKSTISDNTIAIILNSPCNPVGDVLSNDVIDGISKIVKENDLLVISDEVYNSIVFKENYNLNSIITRPDMADRSVVIDSCSKRFAMTGYRVGFAVGPEYLISRMTKMQENVCACAPLPSQYAAIKAYSGDIDYSYIREEYKKRRDYLYNALIHVPGFNPIYPEATFYCFVDISNTGLNGEEYAYELLKRKHVSVVPGIAYGDEFENYIRIAFTIPIPKLKEAVSRITEFNSELIN